MKFIIEIIPNSELWWFCNKQKIDVSFNEELILSDNLKELLPIIELTKENKSFEFELLLWASFTRKESEQIKLFEMQTKAARDYTSIEVYENEQKKYNKELPLIKNNHNYLRRNIDKFFSKRQLIEKLENDRLGCDDITGMFVVTKELVDKLKSCGISGIKTYPIFDEFGHCLDDRFLLGGEKILPDIIDDFLYKTIHIDNANTCFKRAQYCGFLRYQHSPELFLCDINETIEPFIERGGLIVSKRFVDTIKKEKIKGVKFWSVLTTDTEIYYSYMEKVEKINKLIAEMENINFYYSR